MRWSGRYIWWLQRTFFLDKFGGFTLKETNFDFVAVMFWGSLLSKELPEIYLNLCLE